MIVELTVVAGLYSGYKWCKNAELRKVKQKWLDILQASKSEGIRNKSDETFMISKIYHKPFGYLCTVNIPDGLSLNSLINAKRMIEDNFNCILEIEKERFEDYVKVKIINKVLDFDYAPVVTKSNELFLGYKLDGAKFLLNLNLDAHALVAGKTGTGKSFLFASILTNLIYHNKKDFEIYLLQVMKGEIDIFRNCPSVKFTSDNVNEILVILKKLVDIIHRRSKQFTEMGVKNISQWNQNYPSQKMKRIIVGVEEISFFMNQTQDDENPCFKYFIDIVKAGRSAGVHCICLTQRTTVANLPSELKAQMSVLTAKQRSELDSRNAIDIPDAAYLEKQEFIASTNDGYTKFKAPTIDENFLILNKYVPEIKIPEVKDKKVSDNNKLSYEETQKLKTYSDCHNLEKTKPKEEIKKVITPKISRNKKGVKAC